jgi:DNA-binding CsgD family transcriptional regulator
MNSKIDYMAVLSHGVGILRREQLRRFIAEISRQRIYYENERGPCGEALNIIFQQAVHDVIVVVLNLVMPTKGRNSVRNRIIDRARMSSDPNGVCRKEIQRLVQREFVRRIYTPQQRQIYRKVAKAVLEMEAEGILQSNMPSRKKWITRFIMEHRRNKESSVTIAQKLNQLGSKTEGGEEWTHHEVSDLLIECGGPLKKVGLKLWGKGWLRRISRTNHQDLVDCLDPIPLYLTEDTQVFKHEPKLFDHRLLPGIIPRLLEINDAALTIGQIARLIEELLVPSPYRLDREMSLYTGSEERQSATRSLPPIDVIPSGMVTSEEIVVAAQLKRKLAECLDPGEREILEKRLKGESTRSIAKDLGISLGTVFNRMQSIRSKADQLGLKV